MTIRGSLAAVVVAAAAMFAGTARGLFAHAVLQTSEPPHGATLTVAPTELRLSYNEQIDLAVSAVVVHGPRGRVEVGRLHVAERRVLVAPLTGTLSDGGYKVSWQTAGLDGHVEKGVLTFLLKRAR